MMTAANGYGFIGLGAMGYPMAANMRQKMPSDITLWIYDVVAPTLQKFVAENEHYGKISVADSAAQVTAESRIIVTIVPEGKHVETVYSSTSEGALSADVTGKIFIESSTIDVRTSMKVSSEVQKRGAVFIDCPVSGGTSGAEAGAITFMIGAPEDSPHLGTIRPVLETMGTNLIPCGGPTLGLATKLCNNYIAGGIAVATSEGMNMAVRLGLDPKLFSKVVAVSTGGSWVNSSCNPCPGVVASAPASKNYEPGFKVELMRKDYGLAIQAAREVGAKLVLGDAVLQTYTDAAQDPACAGRDCRVVYRFLGGKE